MSGAALKGLRVVVVDDEETVLSFLQDCLHSLGASVECLSRGAAARWIPRSRQ